MRNLYKVTISDKEIYKVVANNICDAIASLKYSTLLPSDATEEEREAWYKKVDDATSIIRVETNIIY